MKYIEEIHGITLQGAFEENKIGNRRGAILRRKTRLQIPMIVVLDWIETVSRNVQAHVQLLLNELSFNISFIIMIGGFSNSPVLLEEIKSVVGDTSIFAPEEAELAVVKGAVLFGWTPSAITTRRSKYSYGIENTPKFKVGIHLPPKKITDDDGIDRCKNIFDTLVAEMQEVEIGKVVRQTRNPIRYNQKKIRLKVYYSAHKGVRYTDERGCMYLGDILVPMPDVTGDKSRKVDVLVTFGETELHVDAQDRTSGKKMNASFDFLTE